MAYEFHGSHGGERFEMPDTIELLIADSASNLVARLNQPQRARPDIPVSWQSSFSPPRPENVPKMVLDASGVLRLESGNFILLHEANEDLDAWAILVPLEFQRDAELIAFRPRGTIQMALPPTLFIMKSYLYILNRPADHDGMATYVSGLKDGALSHAELLFALAASGEAAIQCERLLLYPMAGASALDGGIENAVVGASDIYFVSKATFAEPAD